MEDINTKIENGGATPDGQLSAAEYNDRNDELETAVTRSGQALTVSETTQLAEALFLNGTKAHSFQDGGAVNAVDLTPISGASGVKVPASYDDMDGAVVSFKPAVNNTGAVTVDIGQTSGIGTQPLVLSTDFSALVGAELDTTLTAQIQYDLGNSRWLLLPWSLPAAALTLPLATTQGGTGAVNIADARTNLDVPPNSRNLTVSGLVTGGGTLASNRNFDVTASSLAQAEAGTNNTTSMTPLRVAEAIAALGSTGLTSVQVFTPGDVIWNRPTGAKSVLIFCTGGGGGGGGYNLNSTSSGGGGSGATAMLFYDVTSVPSLTLFVGSGGSAGGNGSDGTGGISSQVTDGGLIANAGGGSRGNQGINLVSNGIEMRRDFPSGGNGGIASTGDLLLGGAEGLSGDTFAWNTELTVDTTQPASATLPVDYGSTYSTVSRGGAGGASFWGGGGPGSTASNNGAFVGHQGATPTAPGAGGGGAGWLSAFGGNPTVGADGVIVILEYF